VSSPRITYIRRGVGARETELSALSAVYKFMLFGSQARRGDPYDLTNGSTAEVTKNGPRKTEQEKT
jgi:hypothetical protein